MRHPDSAAELLLIAISMTHARECNMSKRCSIVLQLPRTVTNEVVNKAMLVAFTPFFIENESLLLKSNRKITYVGGSFLPISFGATVTQIYSDSSSCY